MKKLSNKMMLLQLKFGVTAKQCEGHTDDRLLFTNSLGALVKAVNEFESFTIESPIIKIAFSNEYDERVKELERLQKSLADRQMIKLD